ncbi:hypothetical protein LJC48_05345 [Desulfovibrio sp. OttesenSCG-928-C06]|nr:hypothetical protein [Desulfovibrio sp. OttesenSCG-928-C06]
MGKRLFQPGFLPHALLLLVCCLGLCACGAQTPPRIAVFALDGPPLAVVGAQGDIELIESPDDAARLHDMAGTAGAADMTDMNAAPDVPDIADMPDKQPFSVDDAQGKGVLTAAEAGSGTSASAADSGAASSPASVEGGGESGLSGVEGGKSAPVAAPPAYRVVNEVRFSGEMERGLLAGIGRFSLENPATGLVCAGDVDTAPSRKGRFRGIVPCGNGEFFLFTLSHQGPDQGAGIGRFASATEAVDATTLDAAETDAAKKSASTTGAANTAESIDAADAGEAVNAADAANVEDAAKAGKTSDTNTEKSTDISDAPELTIHGGPPVLFFYHPWREEAERRLADMQKNLAAHIKNAEDKQVD